MTIKTPSENSPLYHVLWTYGKTLRIGGFYVIGILKKVEKLMGGADRIKIM